MFRINSNITTEIVDEIYRKLTKNSTADLVQINKEISHMLYAGVEIPLDKDRTYTAKLIDRDDIENNIFNVVNQYTIRGYKEKRVDIILFINGIPIVVFELKSAIREEVDIQNAYNQIKNYQLDVPKLFYYNAFNVITDGVNARIGTITSNFSRYMTWKSKDGEKPTKDVNQLETLLEGVLKKERLLDIITNFIVFQTKDDKTNKIIAGYHQYFAVKKSIQSTKKAFKEEGTMQRKAGVVWHTQGSGKSFTMVFYTGLVSKDFEFENPTIVVLTDRNDLDNQLFNTFSSCNKDILPQTPKQAKNGEELKELLKVNEGGIIFTTIQKFRERTPILTERKNIIFIADEAHRSQYGLTSKLDYKTGEWKQGYAKNMRDALPNATFIGFTRTPIEFLDRNTRELFGDYIDIYDMSQAVEDKAIVPIYYENRIAKLKLEDERLKDIDQKYFELEEKEEATKETLEKSKEELAKIETIIGSDERLSIIAKDIIKDYEQRKDILEGKAMIVCMSRKIAIKLYKKILEIKPDWINKVKPVLTDSNDDPEEWHKITGNKKYRDELAKEFKNKNSEFKIAIVTDMWLTGFDVMELSIMYIDKLMKGHSLIQAISRVNRVCEDKEGGVIIDYIGIVKQLEEALSKYTKKDADKMPKLEEARKIVLDKLEIMKDIFYGFDYSDFFGESNQKRLKTLTDGINYILGLEKEEYRNDFLKEATALSQAESLCRTILDRDVREEIEFFKCVKVGINKIINEGKLTTNEVNEKIMKTIQQAITAEGMIDIFKLTDSKSPEISILSEQNIEKLKKMKHKNTATELLKRLLDDDIRGYQKINFAKSELFSEKLRDIMKKYNKRLIDSMEAMEELFKLSKEIEKAKVESSKRGISEEEYAFYEILTKDLKDENEMNEEILIKLSKELLKTVKINETVDWDKKESSRATMRREVKRLLRKYNYPAIYADDIARIVVRQAEQSSYYNIVEEG